jgi:predicted nucleic acid-binding protein
MKYIVDTQMLVRATRSEEEAERYATFLSAFSSSVYLCSVVAQELLAGSRDTEARRLEAFIARFEKLRRTATPTHASWRRAGEILCRLRRAGFTITPSLTNDVLIACTAMQIGAEVIHDNARDYRAIQARLSFRHRTDYPPVAP